MSMFLSVFVRRLGNLAQYVNKRKLLDHGWIKADKLLEPPFNKFYKVSFSRSSGPGGQKVNKTSSKVTLTVDQNQFYQGVKLLLPPDELVKPSSAVDEKQVRNQLLSLLWANNRYLKSQGLVIQSDVYRSQSENLKECLDRFLGELQNGLKCLGLLDKETSEEDKQKWEKRHLLNRERRLAEKKKHSEKKKLRKQAFW
ncbi:hypothetical protein PP7435_CHR2-0791 [Komagataella phaffii CBS 7435]|uniref:Prokaryotic-type class I peptide chain release factors domain-containing protein n=2 Tax=Komagataella phaffii TaxID=460519 RepID=C4R0W0_KOMPG|nr:Hypothetical protein PAS_chr2-1_0503 [Komagataella phaffii GS115]AOA62066.1 GQ67_00549T0 [Komagataella phaffii]CAH2448344.1 hypothetical protein BQ9382_C2-4260 [Komagataella phaffii CBS 7435]AOA68172.1 GQ68_00839T0 [Komagataella phaffii GS115]CAY69134.1 Hypothetical protein PAS_chr2-1_0503 [Komagataella phaffii GS115]SCV12061.1 hypothetical protein PP7435_CHR2-0791 [Komagataella phaffii CBS 7435]